MLVAVAAMAFVACSQEGNEVNVLSKGGKTFEFVAEFNDTRAHFEEKTEGIYPIVWDKNEEFLFASNVLDSSNTPSDVTFSPSKVTFAEDTNKVFLTYTLHDWISSITPNSTVKVFNFNNMTSAYGDGAFTGTYGATQTPTATSVDPNFIALVAQYQVDDNGNPELSSKFEHITAYGQITVKGIDEALKTAVLTIDDYTYNLNVEGLENKVYYFACAPDADVDNFTIRVTTVDDNVYEREYELADGKLSFTAGRINEFSVKDLVKLDKYYFAARYQSYTKTFVLDIIENASGNMLATFEVNKPSDEAILPAGTYSIADGTLSYGCHIVDWNYNYLQTATMTVEHLAKGYHIIVTYTYDGVDYTYECNGTVRANDEYFLNPGDPMPLATPTVSVSVENDYDIVLTWGAIDGAKDYTVSWNYGESSKTVTGTTFTLTGKPFTSYEFSVVANASSEEDANSHAGKESVTLGISKDAKGTVETVFDTMTDLGNNTYKFTVSNTSGTEYTDRDFMVLEFNKAISEGVYSLVDLNYGSGQSHFCVSDNRKPAGYSGYTDSRYSFAYYWIYSNACIYVEESNGSYNFTVFATNDYWFGNGNIFKGTYVAPAPKVALDTPVVTATASETENIITVSWGEVANAVGYKVTFNGNTETVTALTKTYTELDWGTKYDVEVVAVAATDSEVYKDSEAGTASATTIADPNAGDVLEDWATSCSIDSTNMQITINGSNGDTIVASMDKFALNANITLSNITFNGTATTGTGSLRITLGSNSDYIATFEITIDGTTYKGAPNFTL